MAIILNEYKIFYTKLYIDYTTMYNGVISILIFTGSFDMTYFSPKPKICHVKRSCKNKY